MSFNYLKEFDPDLNDQVIGMGEPFMVEIIKDEKDKFSYLITIRERDVSFCDEDTESYDTLFIWKDKRFASQSWAYKFGWAFESQPLIVDEVKEVLKYCSRLTGMKSFW